MNAPVQPRRRSFGSLEAIEFPAPPQAPTIVCLHGFGADAADLAPLAAELDLRRPARWVFPEGLLEVQPFSRGRAWFPIDAADLARAQVSGAAFDLSRARPAGLDQAVAAVAELPAALGQSWDDLIIGGFSQGAMTAVSAALGAARAPRGLFILSGTLVDETRLKALAPARAGLPFFQSHGTRDPLLSYDQAKRLNALLNGAGLKGELLSFDDGHCLPREAVGALGAYLNERLA